MHRLLLNLLACSLPALAIADDTPPRTISFGMPVDCTKVEKCFIQNYVDSDPSKEGWQDYHCGPLSYPDHKGTDFRVYHTGQLDKDIPVIASAGGTVKGIRDEMADVSVRTIGKAAVKDRECGNGVLLVHTGGWETQYCHMKRGSVKVEPGEAIEAGQLLGYMGLSGDTEFPHLHFQVRYQGKIVDPFTGTWMPLAESMKTLRSDRPICLANLDQSLWQEEVRDQLEYVSTTFLGTGFTTTLPTPETIRQGLVSQKHFRDSDNVIVFWAEIAGVKKGDQILAHIAGSDGKVMASHEEIFDKNKAVYINYIGLKRPLKGWEYPSYKVSYRLLRGGETVLLLRDTIDHQLN